MKSKIYSVLTLVAFITLGFSMMSFNTLSDNQAATEISTDGDCDKCKKADCKGDCEVTAEHKCTKECKKDGKCTAENKAEKPRKEATPSKSSCCEKKSCDEKKKE